MTTALSGATPEAPSLTDVVEAPVETATQAAAPVFGLIPPFVERAAGTAAEAASSTAEQAIELEEDELRAFAAALGELRETGKWRDYRDRAAAY